MIENAEGYVALDVAGCGECIKGELLPQKVEGSKGWVMRYEDLLFLTEGRLERLNWKTGITERQERPSRAMRFGTAQVATSTYYPLTGVLDRFCDTSWNAVKPNVDEDGKPMDEAVVEMAEIWNEGNKNEVVNGVPFCTSIDRKCGGEVELEEADVANRGLSRGNFLMAYRNLGRLTRTMEHLGDPVWSVVKARREEYDDDGDVTDARENGEVPARILVEERNGTWSSTVYTKVGESLPSLPTRPFAKVAFIVVTVVGSVKEERLGDHGYETVKALDRCWFDTAALIVGDGGELKWPSGTLDAIADAALEELGEERMGLERYGDRKEQKIRGLFVSLSGPAYLFVDHEFPATPPQDNGG